MVIAVIGPAAAGKSTFSAIAKLYGYNIYDISIGLKALEQCTYDFFLNEGNFHNENENFHTCLKFYKQNYSWLDKISIQMYSWYKTNPLQIHNNKRRNALQYLGTEILRHQYGDTIHIDGLVNWIKDDKSDKIVVESIRFESEIQTLKNTYLDFHPLVICRKDMMTEDLSSHISEQEWKRWSDNADPASFTIIQNDGSLHDYIIKSSSFLHSL